MTDAARLLAAMEALDEAVGFVQTAVLRAQFARAKDAARASLGEIALEDASAAGRALPLEESIAEALASSRAADAASWPTLPEDIAAIDHHELTARELQVLRLLIDGSSDRDIAAALFISPRTASHHVEHILAKLGVDSRTSAATYALRLGFT